jgi:hypothetical protein
MITVTHNGYKIKDFDTMEEVDAYIASILKEYEHLSPSLISDCEIIVKGGKAKLLIYQYYTLYTEVFVIEEK